MEELERQLQNALRQAASEQQRAEDCCSRLQNLEETLQIKDACLKDTTAALNEAKSESRRSAALLQVHETLSKHQSIVTTSCRSAKINGGRTMIMRTGSWVKRRLRLPGSCRRCRTRMQLFRMHRVSESGVYLFVFVCGVSYICAFVYLPPRYSC